MSFLRSKKERPTLLRYERVLVPVSGTEADEPALRLAATLLSGTAGSVVLIHVIEVPFARQLDAEDTAAVPSPMRRSPTPRRSCGGTRCGYETGVQARSAGAAIVDDAVERRADLIVMGLRYKKRFGEPWDAGRTVPYVMRNSTAPVWCLRAETEELARHAMRVIIIGCGRVGARTAAELDSRAITSP